MKYRYILVWLCLLFSVIEVTAQHDKERATLSEFPHVFYKEGDTLIRWIESGIKYELSSRNSPDFADQVAQLENHYTIPLRAALRYDSSAQPVNSRSLTYPGVSKWLALSDVHGQYELFVKLLKQYEVVDQDLNWSFGNAHLIINGDIFDRGDGVTEALWLVFKLQQQAKQNGGKVHYNMGNHEMMILSGDVRYINDKYKATSELFDVTYDTQFSRESFFGQWIRQQTILFSVNDVGFIHAGISPDLLQLGLQPEDIDRLFRDSIFTQSKALYSQSDILDFLTTTNGPVWYRGYFNDENLTSVAIDQSLHWWNTAHIVVGHTTQAHLRALFDKRVFAIDANIKEGETGEVLIFENGNFYRGLWDGTRLKL